MSILLPQVLLPERLDLFFPKRRKLQACRFICKEGCCDFRIEIVTLSKSKFCVLVSVPCTNVPGLPFFVPGTSFVVPDSFNVLGQICRSGDIFRTFWRQMLPFRTVFRRSGISQRILVKERLGCSEHVNLPRHAFFKKMESTQRISTEAEALQVIYVLRPFCVT